MDAGSLEKLNDIIVPSLGEGPWAVGWWWSAAIVLLAVMLLAILNVTAYRRRRYRMIAAASLRELSKQWVDGEWTYQHSEQLAETLKRVAIGGYGRSVTASLTGDRWTRFLNASVKRPWLDEEKSDLLNRLLYANATFNDSDRERVARLLNDCLQWVMEHDETRTPMSFASPTRPGDSTTLANGQLRVVTPEP